MCAVHVWLSLPLQAPLPPQPAATTRLEVDAETEAPNGRLDETKGLTGWLAETTQSGAFQLQWIRVLLTACWRSTGTERRNTSCGGRPEERGTSLDMHLFPDFLFSRAYRWFRSVAFTSSPSFAFSLWTLLLFEAMGDTAYYRSGLAWTGLVS